MTEALRLDGTVASGFEELRDEFERNFTERGDVGAALAVYVDGVPVVDLWGGVADPVTGRPWQPDTPGLVYSVTKGATAVLVNRLAERGLLDLDGPVAAYWPEFGAAGKDRITVAQLLSHQAGLPVPAVPLSRAELIAGEPVVAALAAQEPLWEPGTRHGYHALTFGWLTGELVRRVTGRSLGSLFAEDIARPLGLDFHIGLPRDRASEVAPLIDGVPDPAALDAIDDPAARELVLRIVAAMSDPTSLFARTLSTNGVLPTPHAATWNDPDIYAMEQPAANGITDARSLARLYAACVSEVDGTRILSEQAVQRARTEQVRGPDDVLIGESRFGIGFQLSTPGAPLLGEGSFGHAGAGGALGFGDVTSRVGFGYVQNQLGASLVGEPRTAALIAALGRALA
ncbi:serine hydrolase domain-containing protein [Pseudonocardia parietis]|uniref:CubicO group peptidase (Beta-lactamase class C family) n=1 Tax=Pseudonocardia parietis TaxID=570936 RepID=A0ABS4VSM9_9PSEU|nr:serine hydrolase domain-containing protein [Pseudonocardia parietis]MBP2366931.1 CubicO group peptidase (beta-lactamase class C family) [Pseudonocardia parietis]